MSPRQKTALKNRAPVDLREGEPPAFDCGADDDPISPAKRTSPALTAKRPRKKRVVPKKGKLGDTLDTERISFQQSSPSPQSLPSANSLTIDSTPTTSKEFIDELTNSVGRSELHLVTKGKVRSQQLTFDALLKGATKLELCSPKERTPDTAPHSQHGKKPSPPSPSGSDAEKSASGKKGKQETPTATTNNDAVEKMESALKGLGKLEGEVMNALFPTDGSLPQSYELIATRFGMSVEEVKGIADNALRGLRGVKGPNGRISTVWN